MVQNALLTFIFLALLPDPGPTQVQSLPISSPPDTIPAFPEQSDAAGCPLELPDELFRGVRAACGFGKDKSNSGQSGQLRRVRCCPVLAAWAYSAYSETALSRAGRAAQTASYDLPLLPDDSETCVDGLQNALDSRGIELVKPNETCDLFYCFCGIRLHPFSCPEAVSVSSDGKLVGDERVKKLERDCLGSAGLAGCSKCLHTLHLLNENKTRNASNAEDRSSKKHNRDCQLMGLTWLLAKDRSAYIHTVSAVLRAIMMSVDGSDPRSCSLGSDGMPLAVDSLEIDGQSSSPTSQFPLALYLLSISLSFLSLSV